LSNDAAINDATRQGLLVVVFLRRETVAFRGVQQHTVGRVQILTFGALCRGTPALVCFRKTLTEYRLSAEKLDLPMCLPPRGTSARALAPLLVNCLPLKLTMLFRAILARSTRPLPGCCVFSPSEPPCDLTPASWSPLLRVPSSGTISSSPNGAEPCLLLLPVGLRPSSSAAFPSSGRQWRPRLRLPNCRAILLRRVSGTARRGIVSTLVDQHYEAFRYGLRRPRRPAF
jgi:hypothetical protein